ncbi:MAG: hypothetical protein P8L85_15855 [Rubripirellula sp.]|nr:hypothetical protein [Rubripirellula sp.]
MKLPGHRRRDVLDNATPTIHFGLPTNLNTNSLTHQTTTLANSTRAKNSVTLKLITYLADQFHGREMKHPTKPTTIFKSLASTTIHRQAIANENRPPET